MYYIWFDESDKDGEFYSNFYGGVLIKSEDLEKLYKYINRKIRELKPGFNIGESTATVNPEDRWFYPYSHWSFKPYGYLKDTSLSKKQKNSPTKSTE